MSGDVMSLALLAAALTVTTVASVIALRMRQRAATAVAGGAAQGAAAAVSRAHAELLEAAIRSGGEGLVVRDLAGLEVLRNPAAAALLSGHQAAAVIGEVIDDIARSTTSGVSGEAREVEVLGPPRVAVRVWATPLGDAAIAIHLRDVTEWRHVDRVRRDFVSNVSHELKTPIGALGLLGETMSSETDPDTLRRLADRVARESGRLGRLFEELLDLSTIESLLDVTRARVTVDSIIRDALTRVASAAEARSVELLAEPADIKIACDPRLLASALFNLLDNAVKYSEPGGTVTVDVVSDEAHVKLVVRDSGIGIPQADQARIFERFYRVDRARSRDTGGAGLGLSIVRHVAELHSGRIEVESREGAGSIFRLVLPL